MRVRLRVRVMLVVKVMLVVRVMIRCYPYPYPNQEHGAAADSNVEFEVGNYGTRTTSQLEWWFVVEPTAARLRELGRSEWPADVKLRTPENMHRCRKPLTLG